MPAVAPAAAPVAAPVPAPAPAATPEVVAPCRSVQVTFGDGPMGIDLKMLEPSDPLTVAYLRCPPHRAQHSHRRASPSPLFLSMAPQTFGAPEVGVVAIKRTIGQAQSLGLQVRRCPREEGIFGCDSETRCLLPATCRKTTSSRL